MGNNSSSLQPGDLVKITKRNTEWIGQVAAVHDKSGDSAVEVINDYYLVHGKLAPLPIRFPRPNGAYWCDEEGKHITKIYPESPVHLFAYTLGDVNLYDVDTLKLWRKLKTEEREWYEALFENSISNQKNFLEKEVFFQNKLKNSRPKPDAAPIVNDTGIASAPANSQENNSEGIIEPPPYPEEGS